MGGWQYLLSQQTECMDSIHTWIQYPMWLIKQTNLARKNSARQVHRKAVSVNVVSCQLQSTPVKVQITSWKTRTTIFFLASPYHTTLFSRQEQDLRQSFQQPHWSKTRVTGKLTQVTRCRSSSCRWGNNIQPWPLRPCNNLSPWLS